MTNSPPLPRHSSPGKAPAHSRPLWVWILAVPTVVLYLAFFFDLAQTLSGAHR
jgi:hypothetical protein